MVLLPVVLCNVKHISLWNTRAKVLVKLVELFCCGLIGAYLDNLDSNLMDVSVSSIGIHHGNTPDVAGSSQSLVPLPIAK